jgi:hypothetical protein
VKQQITEKIKEVLERKTSVKLQNRNDPELIFNNLIFKNFAQHAKKYSNLIDFIFAHYEKVEKKNVDIQKTANFYLNLINNNVRPSQMLVSRFK